MFIQGARYVHKYFHKLSFERNKFRIQAEAASDALD